MEEPCPKCKSEDTLIDKHGRFICLKCGFRNGFDDKERRR